MADNTITTIAVALAAGILPPLLWLLFFWLREDKAKPEPKYIIALVFVLGIAVAYPAYKLQNLMRVFFTENSFWLFASWVVIEEILKFLAAYLGAMWHNKAFDEPIDAMVYLITAAIGYSAIENFLFLYVGIAQNGMLSALASNGDRFIGATMVHVLSSATLGACIGFAFYRAPFVKAKRLFLGLILAIILHTTYNQLIIRTDGTNIGSMFSIFGMTWIGIIIILFFFEKIKSIFITQK